MPKNKPNKGLLKRVKITKSGKIKCGRAFGRHLRSHKSGNLLRSYRKSRYASGPEAKRMRAMLMTKVRGGNSASDKPKPVEATTE